jgi:hypothetical protein
MAPPHLAAEGGSDVGALPTMSAMRAETEL